MARGRRRHTYIGLIEDYLEKGSIKVARINEQVRRDWCGWRTRKKVVRSVASGGL